MHKKYLLACRDCKASAGKGPPCSAAAWAAPCSAAACAAPMGRADDVRAAGGIGGAAANMV